MGVMSEVVLMLGNVKAYRGVAVVGGVIQLSDEDAVRHLDSMYGEAIVCNVAFAPGGALRQLSPLLFELAKENYKEELQNSLMSQLIQGNDVDIDFHD